MSTELLALCTVCLTVGGGVVGSLIQKGKSNAGKQKEKAEAEGSYIHNFTDLIEIYRKITSDLKTELSLVQQECIETRKELILVKQEVHQLRIENRQLKEKIST